MFPVTPRGSRPTLRSVKHLEPLRQVLVGGLRPQSGLAAHWASRAYAHQLRLLFLSRIARMVSHDRIRTPEAEGQARLVSGIVAPGFKLA